MTMFETLLGQQLLKYLDESPLVGFYHANSIDGRQRHAVIKLLLRNNMRMGVYNRFIVRETLKVESTEFTERRNWIEVVGENISSFHLSFFYHPLEYKICCSATVVCIPRHDGIQQKSRREQFVEDAKENVTIYIIRLKETYFRIWRSRY